MPFEKIPVDSKAATHAAYDKESKTIRVWYTGGGIYDFNAEPHEHEALMNAPSFGRHLNTHFRGRGRRVD
jgi:hypothetical protein